LNAVGQTIANMFLQERRQGAIQALQQALLAQMRVRFKKVPKAIEKVILATQDLAQLNAWLDNLFNAVGPPGRNTGPGP
jgi:hypothetical protein